MNSPTGGLRIDAALLAAVIEELGRRGKGVREAGAFLLTEPRQEPGGEPDQAWPPVTDVAFYDDLDPQCLDGAITFSADGYTALAARCRRDHVRVVADIHTHPRRSVRQSHIDAVHPMVALPGHIALIVPTFALGQIDLEDLGVHVFNGPGQWTSYFGTDITAVLRITAPASGRTAASAVSARFKRALRALFRQFRSWRSQ